MIPIDQKIAPYSLSWKDILTNLKGSLNKVELATLMESKGIHLEDNILLISIQGKFACDFLNHQDRKMFIQEQVQKITASELELKFILSDLAPELDQTRPKTLESKTQAPKEAKQKSQESGTVFQDNTTNNITLNPRYTFSTFIQGNSNNLACAAAQAVANNPVHSYNPLFIYGGVGLGKTHLMHAIGHAIRKQNPTANITYMSAERFTNELVDAIADSNSANRSKKMVRFRQYRNTDILLIDDIQFLANKERTQEEFFHTFNALHSMNKQIVISSDRPPKQIPTLEDRLRSRFEWGMIADIQSPDFETRLAILKAKANSNNVLLPSNVAEYIANNIPSNIRELEGALTRVMAFSSLYKRAINLELVQEALDGIITQSHSQHLDIELIQTTICDYFSISMKDILGKKRDQKIVRPRQLAMYLSKELTDASYPEIGQKFGGKDHTTVMHSCRRVRDNLSDPYFRTSLENVKNRLKGYSS